MDDQLTPEAIISLRKSYGLTQQAFARLLGIGEATMNRYEKGVTPTRANANLLRAAMIPEFMADCLRRDGHQLTAKQRESVESVVYAELTFDEEGEVMDVNELYTLTLQQEVLNEKAWGVIADASRLRAEALEKGDQTLATIYKDIELGAAKAIPQILSCESLNSADLEKLQEQIGSFQGLLESQAPKSR